MAHREGTEAPATVSGGPGSTWGGAGDGGVLAEGEVIDRYEVEAWIGGGGVASVYRVRHRTLGTLRALKVLRVLGVEVFERLLAEGRLQSSLVHPHIVRVQDVLEVRGAPALLLDYVPGPTLAQHLAAGRMDAGEVARLFRGLTLGVAFAHQHRVVHRDLKPSNVLLIEVDGLLVPRITDFGIARVLGPVDGTAEAGLTQTGAVIGTPDYMAPEQLRHAQVDARADLFSLGVILYEMACGRRPFEGPDLLTRLNAVARGEYTPPTALRPDLPRPLVRAIQACLVPDVERRVQTCEALLALLDSPAPAPVEAPRPVPADSSPRPRRGAAPLVAAGVLLLTGLGLSITHLTRTEAAARAAHLEAQAWRRASQQPAEALALLLAAAADRPPEARAALVGLEELHHLARRGGASRVIPAGGEVYSLAVSPDGARVAAGVIEAGLKVWDLNTGAELLHVTRHMDRILTDVRYAPDGNLLLIVPDVTGERADGASPIRVLDAATGRERFTLTHGERPMSVEVSQSGRWAVSSSYDGRVMSWDFESGSPVASRAALQGAAAPSYRLTHDGSRVVLTTPDRAEALVLGVPGLDPSKVIPLPTRPGACSIHLAPDDTWGVLACTQGLFTITLDGQLLATDPHRAGVGLAAQDGEGRWLITARRSPAAWIWSLPTLTPLATLLGHTASVVALAADPGGRWVTTALSDGRLSTWQPELGRELYTHLGHTAAILDLTTANTAGGAVLVSGSRDSTLRVWPADGSDDGRAPLQRLPSVTGQVWASPSGERILTLEGPVAWLRGWREGASAVGEVLAAGAGVLHVGFSADEGQAGVLSDRRLSWLSWVSGPTVVGHVEVPEAARWVRLDGEGRRAVVWGDEKWVAVVDGDPLRVRLFPLAFTPFRLDLTPGDREALICPRRGSPSLLQLDDGAVSTLPVLDRMRGSVVRALPDGQGALFGDFDGNLMKVDYRAGQVLAELRGHTDAVMGLEVSESAGLVASLSWDRTVRLWTLNGGTPRAVLLHPGSEPTAAAFSPDGLLLATGTRDGTLRLWRTKDGALMALRRMSTIVTELAFVEDGAVLRVVDQDGGRAQWRVPSADEGVDALRLAGRLTNLRVCPGTDRVVPVLPYPEPAELWAPPEACVEAPAEP